MSQAETEKYMKKKLSLARELCIIKAIMAFAVFTAETLLNWKILSHLQISILVSATNSPGIYQYDT